MRDVFISYSSKEYDDVNTIRITLEKNGITCWMAPKDIPIGSSYMEEIPLAIKNCTVFLLMLSDEAQKSEWVPKELDIAFKNKKKVLPFMLKNCILKDSFDFCLTNVQRREVFDSVSDNLKELIIQIRTICGKPNIPVYETQNNENSLLKSTYSMVNHNFMGREQEIEKIRNQLETDRVVFIHGFGGVGKTEIAREYISRYKNNYDTVIIAHYETSLTDVIISNKYFNIDGFERNPMESDESFCQRKLTKIKEITSENTLFIIDNFDTEEDDMLEDFLSAPYKVIITTRMNYSDLGFQIEVGAMDLEEQEQFFIRNYKRTVQEQDKIWLKKILSLVSGHTLAIELIAKLMNTKRISFKAMTELLEYKGITPDISGNIKSGFKKSGTVYSHIESIFDLESLSDKEMYIMRNLSLLPISGVRFDEFMEWCELDDAEIINQLIDKSWIRCISPDNHQENDIISLHPLISDIVRSKTDDFFESCSTMINSLGRIFHQSWNISKNEKEKYGEYAKSLYFKLNVKKKKFFYFYQSMLDIFKYLDYTDLCYNLIRELLKIIKKDTIESSWIEFNFADIHLKYQEFDKSLIHMNNSISIMRKIYPESYDFAFFTKHLAHIYHAVYHINLKDKTLIATAHDYLEESEKIFNICKTKTENISGSNIYFFGRDKNDKDTQYASRQYAFSLNYFYSEKHEMALMFATESYEIFKKIYGEINSDTNAPMRVMAMTYSKLGQFDKAIDMENKVINAREILWSKNNFRCFEQYETLADIYIESGNINEGIKNLEYALQCAFENETTYATYIEYLKKKIDNIRTTIQY